MLYSIFISVLAATYIIITINVYSWSKECAFEEMGLEDTKKERAACLGFSLAWPLVVLIGLIIWVEKKTRRFFKSKRE